MDGKRIYIERGSTYIEIIAVVAIIAILLGVAVMSTRQRPDTELDNAAELVQSALVEAREKARAPKPSTPLNVASDVNGYGVRFKPNGDPKTFITFEDKIDSTTPANQNKWVDPNSTSPDTLDDKIISTYKFTDNNIPHVSVSNISKSDGSNNLVNIDDSIVFKTSEIPSERLIYFNGNSSYDWVAVILTSNESSGTRKVIVDFNSGEVKIEGEELTTETVTIGSQVWMRKNMNVGTMVPGASEQNLGEKYCYNDNENNCTTYGALYQWNTAMNGSITEGAQGICPAGFHIPTDAEWKTLEISLGMTQAQADATGWRGTDQGTKLKPGGSSGFEGLSAGLRYNSGIFDLLDTGGHYWTSSEIASDAWYRVLFVGNPQVNRDEFWKNFGYSVRCIKNP